MRLQLLRSATVKLHFADRVFLIDPWFAGKGEGRSYTGDRRSPLVDLPLPLDQILDGVDAVLVSHLHSDHFDDEARAILPKRIPVLCAPRDASAIAADGFQDVTAMFGPVGFGSVSVTLTGGEHGPSAALAEMGAVSGFVFQATGEPTIYWVGDSILCDEVRRTVGRYRPDVVVVHACGARWGSHAPLVMDAVMVTELLGLAPAATVVATHMDAVDHATVSRRELRETVDRASPDAAVRLVIPADGETLTFGLRR